MQSDIFRASATKAVAKKTGHRIAATTFEVGSQDVGRHGVILTLEIEFVKCWIVKTGVEAEHAFFRHEKHSHYLLAYSV